MQHDDLIFNIYCKMITLINLLNICLHTYLQAMVFLVMRTFRSYSLSNFQTCNMALLTTVTMLYLNCS